MHPLPHIPLGQPLPLPHNLKTDHQLSRIFQLSIQPTATILTKPTDPKLLKADPLLLRRMAGYK